MLGDGQIRQKQHKTLKKSCITRWNSIYEMIDSVLVLWTDAQEALKVIGDRDYCLSDEDKLILIQLRCFLKPFSELMELVSAE